MFLPALLLTPLTIGLSLGSYLNYPFNRQLSPCRVVDEAMHNAGFMVRDCAYIDPFVYWRIEHRMTWTGARAACQQVKGGDLISIHDFNEKRVATAMAQNNHITNDKDKNLNDIGVWIGLSTGVLDEQKGRSFPSWKWSDSAPVTYTDWITSAVSEQNDMFNELVRNDALQSAQQVDPKVLSDDGEIGSGEMDTYKFSQNQAEPAQTDPPIPDRSLFFEQDGRCANIRSLVDWTQRTVAVGWMPASCRTRMKAICKSPRKMLVPMGK